MTTIPYPDDTLVVFSEMAANSIIAYPNEANVAQTLTLGASSNLILQASNNGTVSLQTSDGEYLRFAKGSNATSVVSTSKIALAPGDASSTVLLGDVQLTYDNTHTYQVMSAQASNGIYMPNTLTLGSNLVIGGTMATMSSFASRDVSVFKAFTPPTGCNTDIVQVGYTLQINDSNQNLQFVRYNKYQDNTTSYTVVATFGSSPNVGLVPAAPTDGFNQMSLTVPSVSTVIYVTAVGTYPPSAVAQGSTESLVQGDVTYIFSNAGLNGAGSAWVWDDDSESITYLDGYGTGDGPFTYNYDSYTGAEKGAWFQMGVSPALALNAYQLIMFQWDTFVAWKVFGSMNSTNWVELDSRDVGASWPHGDTPMDYTFTNETPYAYYRVVVVKSTTWAPAIRDFTFKRV